MLDHIKAAVDNPTQANLDLMAEAIKSNLSHLNADEAVSEVDRIWETSAPDRRGLYLGKYGPLGLMYVQGIGKVDLAIDTFQGQVRLRALRRFEADGQWQDAVDAIALV